MQEHCTTAEDGSVRARPKKVSMCTYATRSLTWQAEGGRRKRSTRTTVGRKVKREEKQMTAVVPEAE